MLEHYAVRCDVTPSYVTNSVASWQVKVTIAQHSSQKFILMLKFGED